MSKYDRSVVALQLEPLYTAEAKRKSQANLKRGSSVPDRQNSDTREVVRTDEQLAKLAGTSRDTIRKVIEAIRATPLQGAAQKQCNLVLLYILIMHQLGYLMLFMHDSQKIQADPRRSLAQAVRADGRGASKNHRFVCLPRPSKLRRAGRLRQGAAQVPQAAARDTGTSSRSSVRISHDSDNDNDRSSSPTDGRCDR